MSKATDTITGNSGPGSHVLEKGVDRLAKGAHNRIDSASDAAGPAIDRMTSRAHNAVNKADEVATQAAVAIEAFGVKTEELAATGVNYMRKHPLLSLSLAVAAGYVLSRLLASR